MYESQLTGKVDDCIKTDEEGDYFDLGSDLGDITSDITCEAWIKLQDKQGQEKGDFCVVGNWLKYKGYMLHGSSKGDEKFLRMYINEKRTNTSYSTYDTWYHVVGTWDSSLDIISFYLNSNLEDTLVHNTLSDPSNNAYISIYGNQEVRWLYGNIDELRISNIARSSEWISTQYKNQNDPSSFFDVGPEELAP